MNTEGLGCFVIAKAKLTIAPPGKPERVIVVDVRESIEAFVSAWGKCHDDFGNVRPGTRMLLVIDGRIYRDVIGLVDIDPNGQESDALKS